VRSNLNGYQTPQFRMLSEDQLVDLHRYACHILERTGVVIHHEEALALLRKAGAHISDSNRVRIPAGMVEAALKTAPSRITLYSRDGEPAMFLEGYNSYFGTGSDCPHYLDAFTHERRQPTLKDIEASLILCDSLPHIDFVMSMGLINDAPKEVMYQNQYRSMINLTTKPMVIIADDADCLKDIIDMAAVVVGGHEELRIHPRFVLYDEPSSPLQHSNTALQKLLVMAEYGLPTNYAPGAMAGATCPMTPAGAMAQSAAEILSGLVIHQLKSPGAPFVFGGGMSPMDMGSMQPTYAAPEAMMTQSGLVELAHYYNLPTWGFGGCSSSKLPDQQAIMEACTFNLVAALSGCNIIHDVGYLEFGLTFSEELLVMCNENIGQIKRVMGGIKFDDEHLAFDTIDRVGPGGNYLGDPHTFAHFRDNWWPDVTNRQTFEAWAEGGKTSMEERAREKIRFIQQNHTPKTLDDVTLKKLGEIIAAAEKRSADKLAIR